MPDTCRICAEPLEQSGKGLPRRYCSTTCRRAAAYEIKRLNQHLQGIEWRRDGLRRMLLLYKHTARRNRELDHELSVLEGEIDGYTGRLVAIL
jgi:hypothetical protein